MYLCNIDASILGLCIREKIFVLDVRMGEDKGIRVMLYALH